MGQVRLFSFHFLFGPPEFIVELLQSVGLPLRIERNGRPIAVAEDLFGKADIAATVIKNPARSRPAHNVCRAELKTRLFERLVVGELDIAIIERFTVTVVGARF